MKKPTCQCAQDALKRSQFKFQCMYEDCEQVAVAKPLCDELKGKEKNVRVWLRNNFCPQCGSPYEEIKEDTKPKEVLLQ